MRSFRLDPDSINDFVKCWPWILFWALVGCAIGIFCTAYLWGRILIPIVFGIALGPRLFDGHIQKRYPTAFCVWLVSLGLMTCLVGVTLRMSFPHWQGTGFDTAWLGVAFISILAFVLLNRENSDVFR